MEITQIYYEYFDDSGTPYYFNPKTSETQWDRPTDGIVEQPPQFDSSAMMQMAGQPTAGPGASPDPNSMYMQNYYLQSAAGAGAGHSGVKVSNIPTEWSKLG